MLANTDRCAYCGAGGKLQHEHLIPLATAGPDTFDNLVLACGPCNGSKGARNPVDWYDARGLDRAHIPRLVMGKLLKLWMEEHRRLGTLDATEFPPGEPVRFRGVRLVFGAGS